MKDGKLKQILLIHPLKFVCEGITKFAGAQGVSVFYLERPEPFLYLVKDLEPDVLIVHNSLAEELHDDLEGASILGTPIIFIGEFEGHTCLPEPLELSSITAKISNILALNPQNH